MSKRIFGSLIPLFLLLCFKQKRALGQPALPPLQPCNGADRGWLSGGSLIGAHPNGTFGPSGLHGAHFRIPNNSSDFDITVLTNDEVDNYYPDQEYTIKVFCSTTCAFLLTVEAGSLAESSWDKQRGTFLDVDTNDRIRLFTGQNNFIAVTNTELMARDYSIRWRAPPSLTYDPLFIRATYVLDVEATCPGAFTQFELESQVVCGDFFLDPVEACDDGNTISGDGCTSTCQIEQGWTCDTIQLPTPQYPFKNGQYSNCIQARLVLDPAGGEVQVVEGFFANYNLYLSRPVQMGETVTVTLVAEPGEISVFIPSSSTIVFTGGNLGNTAWNVNRSVAIRVEGNDLIDAQRTRTVTHYVTSTDSNYDFNYRQTELGGPAVLPPLNMSIIVLDDDSKGVIASKTNVNVSETGLSDSYTIRLSSEPEGIVMVKISTFPPNQLQVDPRVPFDNTNWNIPVTVFVNALDNNDIDGRLVGTISHEIDPETTTDPKYIGLNLSSIDITVIINDNDDPGMIVMPRSIQVTEAETETFYYVSMASTPAQGLIVNITVQEGLVAVANSTGLPYISFDRTNWNKPQAVKVTAVDNQFNEGPRAPIISHFLTTMDMNYFNLNDGPQAPWEVTVDVSDNDVSAVLFQDDLTVIEGAGTTSFPITLQTVPYAAVRVDLELDDASYLSFGGVLSQGASRYVEWQPHEWNQTRTVLVQTLADNQYPDNTDEGDRTTFLRLTSSSNDPKYDSLTLKPVQVTTLDNDQAAVIFNPSSGIQVVEGGQVSLQVSLNTRPQLKDDGSSQIITISFITDSQLQVEPSSLSFATRNFSDLTYVTLFGTDDTILEDANHASTLRFQITTSDPEYAKLSLPDMRVTIIENDARSVTRLVNVWGDSLSPFSPFGAVVATIPVGAVPTGGAVLTVAEAEPRPDPGTAGPPKTGVEGFRVSGTYSFEPHGLRFQRSVQISCEYDVSAAEEAGGELIWYRSESSVNGPWLPVTETDGLGLGTFRDGIASIEVTTFSFYYVGASAPAPPPPVQVPPPVVEPCFGLVPPEDDKISDTEYALISILAIENLLGLSAFIAYLAWRRRQAPKIIHVNDEMEELLQLPGGQGGQAGIPSGPSRAMTGVSVGSQGPGRLKSSSGQMTLPGPHDGRAPVMEHAETGLTKSGSLRDLHSNLSTSEEGLTTVVQVPEIYPQKYFS